MQSTSRFHYNKICQYIALHLFVDLTVQIVQWNLDNSSLRGNEKNLTHQIIWEIEVQVISSKIIDISIIEVSV